MPSGSSERDGEITRDAQLKSGGVLEQFEKKKEENKMNIPSSINTKLK